MIEAGCVKGVKFNPLFFIYSLNIAYEHQGMSPHSESRRLKVIRD
jgi:hypothetical protein